jgi:RHS repeat-associated protein
MQYQINGLGQRIAKLKNKPSHPDNDDDGADEFHVKGVTDFVYDKDGHLIGEYTRNGKPIRETVYLGDTPVAVLDGQKAQYFIYPDHLNTPRVITDTRNRIVWRWDASDPFGATPPNENPSGRGTFTFNLRFPGQYFDKETGLHYNYFRNYDPSTGRYIESDPIGLRGGINTYAYVDGYPLAKSDLLGLLDVFVFGALSQEIPLSIVRGSGETIKVFGYSSDKGFYDATIFLVGVQVGSLQNYMSYYKGVELSREGNYGIEVIEGNVGGDVLIAGLGIGSGGYKLSSGELGLFFHGNVKVLGEEIALGVGLPIDLPQYLAATWEQYKNVLPERQRITPTSCLR